MFTNRCFSDQVQRSIHKQSWHLHDVNLQTRSCRRPFKAVAFAAKPGAPKPKRNSLDVGGAAKEEELQNQQPVRRGRTLDLGGVAKEEANAPPRRPGRSLDTGGSARENPNQNQNGLSRPQARPPARSQADKMGKRPEPGRPTANRPNFQQSRPQNGPSSGFRGQGASQARPPQRQPSQKRYREEEDKDPNAPIMNEDLLARFEEVRVIDSKKEPIGVMTTQQALNLALEEDVDLILLNPEAQPPLVRLASLSKLKYEQAKKVKDQRKKERESRSDMKEMRFRPNTEEHDYNVRLKNAKKHLSKGDKVKLVMRFKGRELNFKALGKEMFTRFIADLGDEATVQKDAKLQGNQMILIVGPKTK